MSISKYTDIEYHRFEKMCYQTPEHLDPNKYVILRIDGHNFHTFTRKFLKPFDPLLHILLDLAYLQTCNQLLNKQWTCFYSQSDEVTIVIPPLDNSTQSQLFKGKKAKLLSLVPSAITSRFINNWHNFQKLNDDLKDVKFSLCHLPYTTLFNYPKDYFNKISPSFLKPIEFDARIFQTDNLQDIHDLLQWRRIDAINNSKNMFAQNLIGKKKIMGLKNERKIQIMKETFGFDWYTLPNLIKRGVYLSNSTINFGFWDNDELTERYMNGLIKNG